jgi:two-component system OmpR family sensor kinase
LTHDARGVSLTQGRAATIKDTTDRADAPDGVGQPDSGHLSLSRLPSRLALASIRTRILVGFIVMLAIATMASVVVVGEVLQARLHERIDADLAQQVSDLRRVAAGKDPATGRPFGKDVRRIFRVYFSQNSPSMGETVLTFVNESPFLRSRPVHASYRLDHDAPLVGRLRSLQDTERGSVDTPAGRVEYLSIPLKRDGRVLGSFVVALFSDVLWHPFGEAVLATAVVGLAVLLVGSLLAWRMADSVLRPVRSLTQTAQAISETDLTQRIEVRGHDELAGLAVTLNAMLDRLERTLSSQRRFLDDAGHELRTPITIIRGHLELLEDDAEEREATRVLLLDELDRMSRMVNELILLAKAERSDFLQTEMVDVTPLTGELLTKASALAPRAWVVDSEADGTIVADRQRLTEALMQLAQNAAEHTEEGDEIALGSAVQAGKARFWVRDTGTGIAPADQAQIFDRFERRGPRSHDGGCGLGLSIVRAIAEAHGGRVELRSDLGKGALFTIVVPVAGPSHPRRKAT